MVGCLGVGCGPGGGGGDTSGDDGGSAGDDGSADGGPGDGSNATSATGTDDATGDPTGDATGSSTDDGTACALPPVDDAVIGSLFIDAGLSSFVPVGSSTELRLAWIEAGFPQEVEACVAWSVTGEGASIDPGGVLDIDPATAPGTIVTVTADIEDGRRVLTADFEVYVPLQGSILGFWDELSQLPCDGGEAFTPDPIIGELVFSDTGEFSVTWTPFEVYYDYWGTFTWDEGTGALVLTVEGGNYVPPDIDGEGTAMIVDGELVLQDIWLGVAQRPVTPPACGHVFQ